MAVKKVLSFRVTDVDYQRLHQAARDDGLPLTVLIRFAVSEWLALDGTDEEAYPDRSATPAGNRTPRP